MTPARGTDAAAEAAKRIPGLELYHPRQLALMHALVRFAHIAAGDTFTTRDLHAPTAAALDTTAERVSARLTALRPV